MGEHDQRKDCKENFDSLWRCKFPQWAGMLILAMVGGIVAVGIVVLLGQSAAIAEAKIINSTSTTTLVKPLDDRLRAVETGQATVITQLANIEKTLDRMERSNARTDAKPGKDAQP